ncbi:exopolysaccharide biosynthesis protein [Pseudohoeflea coraliihabitans]|uniref:Exopolysaccharide biosynthesis protein n=1 Tax=Pseudohoeflea coraliihabitans TaxID=2860393 RepID=A0ABS6WM71_9HYPH|nr:exopolysaccharide biosynthesis protein [Pseudohoeflea sp. DP4N28-3]MBW3097058.1 exopolysaccharide biosynthesis protein [Pseudohoeflea sp. DP4N28-3]
MGDIRKIIEALHDAGEGDDIRVSEILDTAGEHSLVPVLLIPALLVVTPLSGVPGVSSAMGIAIALISAQLLIGRKHLWLPGWLMHRQVSRHKYQKALNWMDKPVAVLDSITARRLTVLVHRPMASILHLACLCCGLAMPMLELVPFSSSILGAAVSVMAIALLARDGLFATFAVLFIAAAIAAPIYFGV